MGIRYWHGNEKRLRWQKVIMANPMHVIVNRTALKSGLHISVLTQHFFFPSFCPIAALTFSSSAVTAPRIDVLLFASCPRSALLTLIRTVPMTSSARNWTPVLLICAAGAKANKSALLCSWSLRVQPLQLKGTTESLGGGGWRRKTLYGMDGNLHCHLGLWFSTATCFQ